MTLTKNFENYLLNDKLGEVNVSGHVEKIMEGGINISISTDDGSSAYYSKDINNHVSFNFGFDEDKNIVDYMQTLVENILQALADEQAQ